MKVRFIKSATVVVQSRGGTRLLCDPWTLDGSYLGSWAHSPPCTINPADLKPDAVFVSHVHPDHAHGPSLQQLDPATPVYIHRYAWTYLADYIRSLGMNPIEVPNGETVRIGDLELTIYAADNCDPTVCGQFFGCDAKVGASRPGSTQIDSMAVIHDGVRTIVNVNDCPFELAGPALAAIRKRFGRPDFLLVNYVGAGPYPQCMTNLSDAEKLEKAAVKREQFLEQAAKYIRALEPVAFMPFAGTYTLVGKLAHLNRFRGCPTQQEARADLARRCPDSRAVLLDTGQTYDLEGGCVEGEGVSWSADAVAAYERDVLSQRRMDYEDDPEPDLPALARLFHAADRRFTERRKATGLRSDTAVYIQVGEEVAFCAGNYPTGHAVVPQLVKQLGQPYLIIRTDPRLLVRLLKGEAHWGDASIGSHLMFDRHPDVFERGLFFCLDDLHA